MSTTSKSKPKVTKKKPVSKTRKKSGQMSVKTSEPKSVAGAGLFVRLKSIPRKIFGASLVKWNRSLAVIHGLQAVVIAWLATDFSVTVFRGFLTFNEDTQTLQSAQKAVFDLPLAFLVVAFFALSALAHTLMGWPMRKRYEAWVAEGRNPLRWFEYALSASTMMVAIALLVGENQTTSLAMIFGLTAVMNLLGLAMENANHKKKRSKDVDWTSYWVGTLAGLIPWLVVVCYFVSSWLYGNGNPPTFVYWIFGSIFVFFSSFALVMIRQYRCLDNPKYNYLQTEKAYMVLSLLAKTALAWQVFAGTLRP